MCDKGTLDTILAKTVEQCKRIYGNALKYVILYGSYARGDYDEESDIDIVILVDKDRETLSASFEEIVKFSSDIDLEYGIMLSPSVLPYDEFIKYKEDLPYYTNIASEGVVLRG